MARVSRFKKRLSDRSGLSYLERTMIRDKGVLVGPDEYDTPPPSNKSLGGEGEVNRSGIRSNSTSYETPTDKKRTVQYVTSVGGISSFVETFDSGEILNYGFIYIAGSADNIDITKNPQVSTGKQADKLTLQCVGSSITLQNGNGLTLRTQYRMTSGALLNLFYSVTDNTWHETSRNHLTETLGDS